MIHFSQYVLNTAKQNKKFDKTMGKKPCDEFQGIVVPLQFLRKKYLQVPTWRKVIREEDTEE